jgi:hypothetical protein
MTGGRVPVGGLSREIHMPCTTAFFSRSRVSAGRTAFSRPASRLPLVVPRASSGDDDDDSDDDSPIEDPLEGEESDFDDFDDDFDDDFEEEADDPDWDHPDEETPEMPPGKKK